MENVSGNEQQPFWYSIEFDGADPVNFGYIEQDGNVVCSTFALVLNENGQWEEPNIGNGQYTQSPPVETKIGENSWQVVATTYFLGGNFLLRLVFESEVDFTNPLPLDEFSTSDSKLFILIGDNPGNAQIYPAQSIKPTSPPTASANTDKTADQT